MPTIFIGYRRDDARGSAGRIHDALGRYYGRRRIFRDVETIEAGTDFSEAITASITEADVMLAVIGPDWLSVVDDEGSRRLDDPDDYVRRELELALRDEGIRVLPVLVAGAEMPGEDDLPASIEAFARKQAVPVREDRFADDVSNLIEKIGGRPTIAGWIRTHPWRAATVTAAVAAAAVLVGLSLRPTGPDPLEGVFNVAVAEFATTVGESTLGPSLSSSVFDQLVAEVTEAAPATPGFAGPELLGTIEGDTAEERAANAAELADELNADVVIYGDLSLREGATELVSEFYLSPTNLDEAEELEGAYELGSFEAEGGPAAAERSIMARLTPRISAISELMAGLIHYQSDEYDLAEPRFLAAAVAWPDDGGDAEGKEVIFHLLGNVAGEQGSDRFQDAAAYYEQALEVDGSYARAHFGSAEIQFQQARGKPCGLGDQPSDVEGLEDAAARFRDVQGMEAPPLSFLDVRARVEVARILLCISANRIDRREEARTILDAVVAENADDDRLRNIVGEAHQSLATYHLLAGDPAAAIAEYRLAIEATLNATREALFHFAIGEVYACNLQRPDLAEPEYRQSAALLPDGPEASDCQT